MTGLVGQTLGRYRIVSLLGAGGMGSVYRARDPELGRDVAIKVLLDPATEDPQRLERFNREIRTVARLSHPHIVEIFDFGQVDGVPYAVMELLHGHTLREKLRGRPQPLDRALDIGMAVAGGLGAAHKQGVIHRDIKPENIFVTSRGKVKILDFGLARDVITADPEDQTASIPAELTSPGTVVGTTGYMSPEQVRGQTLDGRSDIFSLGCVLYEMLGGVNPFRRETRVDTQSAILDHDPPPLTELRPALPPALDLIVGRCLRKNPDERFESARDLAFAMQALSESRSPASPAVRETVPVPRRVLHWAAVILVLAAVAVAGLVGARRLLPPELPAVRHVAVVPFDAGGSGADLHEFAVGLAELMASDLSRLENRVREPLWVVSPRDARFMGAATPEAMRRTFNANVVLSGRLHRRGSSISLALTALDPGSGRRFRSTTVDYDLGNVSPFQTEPVIRASEILDLEVPPNVLEWMEQEATSVARAFQPYVRAVGLLAGAAGNADADAAIALLEEAISNDPLFCPARVALGRACGMKYQETQLREWLDRGVAELTRARKLRPCASTLTSLAELQAMAGDSHGAAAALEQAVELAPDSGAAHFALGRVYEDIGRLADAERVYQRSANLRVGYWPGPNRLAGLYYAQGRFDAAANAWRQVTEYAPLCTQGYNNLGAVYFRLGRLHEARSTFERSIEVDPQHNFTAYSNLGTIFDREARFADAATMYREALAIEDGSYDLWGNLGYALTFGAEPERARGPFLQAVELAEQERRSTPNDPGLLSRLAGFYVMTGHRQAAMEVLEQTIALDPRAPGVLADIGETLEDLGERDRALEWIGRALEGGILPSHFAKRPMLRELIADARYQALLDRASASPSPPEGMP